MINSRALTVTGILLLVFVALVIKLFNIQVSNHQYYVLLAERQQNKPQIVKAERGLIKDRNGEVLSFTRDNISFFVDTRMMDSVKTDSVASVFARVMNKPARYYENIIANGTRNICIEKKVPMDKALQLKKYVIDGMFSQEDYTRVYPYGSTASHILGYVNYDCKGVDGLEKVYDETLTGTDGRYVFERDVLGRIIAVDENLSKPPVPGNNVVLTINSNYQKILEEELRNGVEKYEGQSGVGIVMDPNTGEILALANVPDYDPANYSLFPSENRRDKAVTDTYEPGSTMKTIFMSALFEEGLVREDEVINTENGTFFYKNAKISDTHKYDKLTVREVLEESSNIGMAKLSDRLTSEQVYKYLRDFGFSNRTSVELPGETDGYLKKPASFSGITKPFMSFGYEISVTPLQMITAYSAIINGGTLYQPYIVKEITDYQGNALESNSPKKIRQVISGSVSNKMKSILVGVVEQGTGKEAQLQNVLVGGKTGTAQMLINNAYSSKYHNSSFIGFFPADNPRIVCFILVNAPQVGRYGGLVSAPIFRDVARRIIESDISLVPGKKNIERKSNLIESLVADIKSPVKTNSFANVGENKNEYKRERFFNGNRTTMPNLLNQSLRDAIAQLTEMGVRYKIQGTGKIVEQSLEAGSPVQPGSVCVLKCESSKISSLNIN